MRAVLQKKVLILFHSLHAALSLAYLGAPEGSETSLELVNLLGLEPLHTEDYLYNYLRVLFTQQELSEKLNTNIQLANKVKSRPIKTSDIVAFTFRGPSQPASSCMHANHFKTVLRATYVVTTY